MSFLAIFFIVFFFVVLVLGPIFGGERPPGFRDPNRKARQNVWPPWEE
jgi:quinol-cytochrome oxidoreductase complex cytochrome b subunit